MIPITKEQALFLMDYESIGYYNDLNVIGYDTEIIIFQFKEDYYMADIDELKSKDFVQLKTRENKRGGNPCNFGPIGPLGSTALIKEHAVVDLYNRSIYKFKTEQQQMKFWRGIQKTFAKIRNGEL